MPVAHRLLTAAIALLTTALAPPLAAQQEGGADGPSQVRAVLSTMHHMNQLEMRLGELALETGDAESIREYGERIFRDHRFADGKVTSVLHDQGFDFLERGAVPAAQQLGSMAQRADRLGRMSGAQFDQQFLSMMVQSHETAISLLSDALRNMSDGPTRELVTRLRPILEQHLDLARNIEGRLFAARPPGGEGSQEGRS